MMVARDTSLNELLPLSGIGGLYVDGRAICDVQYQIAGAREHDHPDSVWNVVGTVLPVEFASWLMVTAVDILDVDASIDLRQDGLWWDCRIFDDGGAAHPRKRNLYRR